MRLLARKRRLRLFYASDIHGSEKCFLKFINAARFYGIDVLVLGGDLTGKVVIPVVRQGADRYVAQFQGEAHLIDGVRLIVYPGNDDEPWVDQVLAESTVIENADGSVVDLGDHELVGMAFANVTPFNSPRELPEADLEARLEIAISKVRAPEKSIFAFHCPPVNTGLDMAPKLRRRDGELQVVAAAGHTVMEPVGSVAVRNVIERHQPLLGAHGHVHESRAVAKVGRSLCFNPGSEYSEGVLRGALVVLEPDRVVSCQLVAA
jgi:Icc-related predicted phosphoesterase